MPRAEPGSVSADPLAELGIKVRSSVDAIALAGGLGQAPVDHQRLAVLADDDVARLDVAVQHAAAVGVIDGIADVHEAAEKLAQFQVARSRGTGMEPLDRLLQGIAPDEPHGVEGAAVAIGTEAVDRHDARVLQAPGDLGLEQEAFPAGLVIGVVVEDLLEGHLAVELGIERHEDRAQPAPGVRPEHAKPLAVAGGRADGVGGGVVGNVSNLGWRRAKVDEGGCHVGIADLGQALASGVAHGDGGKAPRGIAAVLLQVLGHEAFEQVLAARRQGRRGRGGGRPSTGPCRGSRRERRQRAGPGRSARSGGRAARTGDHAMGMSYGAWPSPPHRHNSNS